MSGAGGWATRLFVIAIFLGVFGKRVKDGRWHLCSQCKKQQGDPHFVSSRFWWILKKILGPFFGWNGFQWWTLLLSLAIETPKRLQKTVVFYFSFWKTNTVAPKVFLSYHEIRTHTRKIIYTPNQVSYTANQVSYTPPSSDERMSSEPAQTPAATVVDQKPPNVFENPLASSHEDLKSIFDDFRASLGLLSGSGGRNLERDSAWSHAWEELLTVL